MSPADNLVRDFIIRDISNAMELFEISRKIEHRGMKGKAREIFVKNLFESLLSGDFKFGSGVVTDRLGRQAKETDVILYCPEVMPARDANEAVGYFPVESCIYAIEVKSAVTAREIEDAIAKGKALETLEPIFFTNFGPLSSRPIPLLFAFSSDLKSGPDEEFNRFKSLIDKASFGPLGVPAVRVFCVAGKGYWFYNVEKKQWFRSAASGQYQNSEILSLTAGLINTIRGEKLRRYGLPFGYYLLDDLPNIAIQ